MNVPISKNWFGEEELAAVQEPLRTGWVAQGPRVREFEQKLSEYTGAKHSIACTSGTAALQIAAAALGIKPGDEVIVPGFTWIATANIVELLGGKPVFCDIDLSFYNANIESLESKLSSRTVGLIPVHLFGLCAEMEAVQQIAKKYGLWVVEDACCALGSYCNDQHAGTIGDVGCFSFHPRKSISTGEGGMVITNNDDTARLCDGIHNHGAVPPPGETSSVGGKPLLPSYSVPGFNYRMTDIQGALGAVQMTRLEFLLAERKRCAAFYAEQLADVAWLRLPQVPGHQVHSWQSYVTLFAPAEPSLENVGPLNAERNRLMQQLAENGISTRQGTHAPAHLDFYRDKYGIRHEDLPNSWLADRLTLALPLFPGLTNDELNYVVDQIKTFQLSF